MRCQQPNIHQRLDKVAADRIANYRQKLHSIVETIVLCRRQNIPLRSHRDNTTDLERDTTASHGNFWALLHFRVAAGDSILRDHLATAARNATYTSADIQNQLIAIVGDQIRNKILSNVKKAQWFTIMADEVTDSSNKEQLSLVIRYVDPDDCGIREDLVDFIECDTGITVRALAEKMLGFLQNHGVDLTKLRSQAYDGAGNMSGGTRGAASLITAQYPLALYLHCASHCLNLAVVKSLEETNIRNMMGVVDRISVFFSASKFEEAIDTTQPESSIHKLKDLCRTCWVQRIDALN